jgi:hypothetical protein
MPRDTVSFGDDRRRPSPGVTSHDRDGDGGSDGNDGNDGNGNTHIREVRMVRVLV